MVAHRDLECAKGSSLEWFNIGTKYINDMTNDIHTPALPYSRQNSGTSFRAKYYFFLTIFLSVFMLYFYSSTVELRKEIASRNETATPEAIQTAIIQCPGVANSVKLFNAPISNGLVADLSRHCENER